MRGLPNRYSFAKVNSGMVYIVVRQKTKAIYGENVFVLIRKIDFLRIKIKKVLTRDKYICIIAIYS